MWRACHKILPTKLSLVMKKVVSNPLCDLCSREPESVGHALWGCPRAQVIWATSSLGLGKMPSVKQDF